MSEGQDGTGDGRGRPGGSSADHPSDDRPVVAATMGDPAGIGPEVLVGAYRDALAHARVLAVGDADVLRGAVAATDADLAVRPVDDVAEAAFDPERLDVVDLDNVAASSLEHGVVSRAYGRASLEYVEWAIDAALEGRVDAITTAPIHKRAVAEAGAEHAGHTGLLAERTGTGEYAMLLVTDELRVSHATTHVPLREVPDLVTRDRVESVVRLTDAACRDLGVADPTLAVAGLNPHAGDGGVLGSEDEETVAPAVAAARASGIDAVGPEPADTVFARAAAGSFDAVVAMYHDQGHVPVKTLAFRHDEPRGVNVTVGLPIVRTSVDHGTAFDVAGRGVASPASMLDAVSVAARLARARRPTG